MPEATFRCHAEPDALPSLQRWLTTCWAQFGLAADMRPAFELALEEVFINIATHARATSAGVFSVACTLQVSDSALELTLRDDGPAFDPLTAPAPDPAVPLAARAPGGVGLALVRHFMDTVSYRRVDGHNELRCRRARTG